jgi:hypothetical protein
MSINVNSVLRGIVNDDLKKIVRVALAKGFILGEVTGTTHHRLIWPQTGEKVGFDSTTTDRTAWKGFARQLETVSGLEIIPRFKKGHEDTKPYVPEMQSLWSRKIEDRLQEYNTLVLEFRIIMSADAGDPTKDINRAFEIVRRMSDIERFLKELRQPLPDPDLTFPSKLAKEFDRAS